MKTKTKLLTALLSTVTALSCALTAAAATTAPALTLKVDETPVSAGMKDNTATATLTAAEFGGVGGVDITLSLQDGISFDSAEVVNTADGSTWTLTKDANYKVDIEENTVRIVDAFNVGSVDVEDLELKITFAIDSASIGEYTVGVTAVMADTDAAKMDEASNTVTGKIVVSRSNATYTADTPEAVSAALTVADDQFIPYGGVYVSDGNKFPEKKGDGTFDTEAITGEFTVLKCKKPANGKVVTTFAVSPGTAGDGKDDKAIQFGSYVPETPADTTYGTFIIIGDYEAFKAAKNITDDQAALQRFAVLYNEKFTNPDENKDFMKFTYNDSGDSILVGRKTQTRIMWQKSDESILQYALRIYGITDSAKLYTAVGYSLKGDTYNFSAEIKSASLNSLN